MRFFIAVIQLSCFSSLSLQDSKSRLFLFFQLKTSFYTVCFIRKQNRSMLYAILRNPDFTSAFFIPICFQNDILGSLLHGSGHMFYSEANLGSCPVPLFLP